MSTLFATKPAYDLPKCGIWLQLSLLLPSSTFSIRLLCSLNDTNEESDLLSGLRLKVCARTVTDAAHSATQPSYEYMTSCLIINYALNNRRRGRSGDCTFNSRPQLDHCELGSQPKLIPTPFKLGTRQGFCKCIGGHIMRRYFLQ